MLERNESTVDRFVRALLGAGLLWMGLRPLAAGRLTIGRIVMVLGGAILGITALTGHCSVYSLLGVSTYRE